MFRFLILGLLRNGAKLHGYALVKAYRERSSTEVSTGNFYRELQRLVLDGLIRSADNPPQADARRTPYAITDVGCDVFDEWFTAREAAGGAASEDDISARALFMGDAQPALVAAVLEHMEENLWFAGKSLERIRQLLPDRPSQPGGFDVLPFLLARRLKRVAADLEFLEEFQSVYADWLASTDQPIPRVLNGRRRTGPTVADARFTDLTPRIRERREARIPSPR
jgi:DNA-binding PadR family transcriptional regulator